MKLKLVLGFALSMYISVVNAILRTHRWVLPESGYFWHNKWPPHKLENIRDVQGPLPKPCFSVKDVPPNQEWFGCTPTKHVNEDGLCNPNWYHMCRQYCESYVEWRYGPEARFTGQHCGPGHCQLQLGLGAEIPLPNWRETSRVDNFTFTMASSFNFLDPNTTARSIMIEKPRDLWHECGYFTFIPFLAKSCGISVYGVGQRVCHKTWCENIKHTSECHETVLQKESGEPDGIIVFVATSCEIDFKLRPFCKQDPMYLKEGVSFNPQLRKEYLAAVYDNGDRSKMMLKDAYRKCQGWSMDRTVLDAEVDGEIPKPPPYIPFRG